MFKDIVKLVKGNKYIYKTYSFLGSLSMNMAKYFIKTNNKRILFVSFGGKKYDDSPKSIFEKMIKDKRFNDFNFVWAFRDINECPNPKKVKIVKINSFKYFYYVLSSKCWITNSSVKRGLNFHKNNVLYINTWHGTPIKKIESDSHYTAKYKSSENTSKIDLFTVQNTFELNIFSKIFNVAKYKFLKTGLPRNDILFKACSNTGFSKEMKNEVCENLNIDENKKLILYAPTFRDNKSESVDEENLSGFIEMLSGEKDDYYILLRGHYETKNLFSTYGNLINVSKYDNLNNLMIASDFLISDYSSVIFDYSILEKPIIMYVYDLDDYKKNRGMYIDIENEFKSHIVKTQQELFCRVTTLNADKEIENSLKIKNKYVEFGGNASTIICDEVHQFVES